MAREIKSNRRYQRIATPKGLWVAWQLDNLKEVSRVRDLNAGGLFIATTVTAPSGAILDVMLSVPEGQIKGQAVVRNVLPGEGMGVEFKNFSATDTERLERLVARLLQANPSEFASNDPPAQ